MKLTHDCPYCGPIEANELGMYVPALRNFALTVEEAAAALRGLEEVGE